MPEIQPFPKKITSVVYPQGNTSQVSPSINFGLWYQKFVPLDEKDKKAAKPGKSSASAYYKDVFDKIMNTDHNRTLSMSLAAIHQRQKELCSHPLPGLVGIEIRASLASALLTGNGAPHASEANMFFDRNLGIPAIPASSVKGFVRLGHILEWLGNHEDKLIGYDWVEDHQIEELPELFGLASEDAVKLKLNGKKWGRGRVVFLDAYPEKVPDLKVDILNPHYPKYYQDDNREWPRDNQDPKPVTFLTVAPGTVFVFRFLVPSILKENLLNAVKRVLIQEGIGAKTSLGYGRFGELEERIQDPAAEIVACKNDVVDRLEKRKNDPGASIEDILKDIEANPALKQDQELESKCREWFKKFPTKGAKKKGKPNSRYLGLAALYGWDKEEVD